MTEATPPSCPRCGQGHGLIACPYVKALEFEDADQTRILRVEFLTPADYGPKVASKPEPEKPPTYPRLGQDENFADRT